MKSNILIKNKSQQSLKKLNEGVENNNQKYIFEGIFTPCSTKEHKNENRNQRIYMEDEVLRHLTYLRENIKNDGCILGELDHPENRFDISLKEASHKITDLWYDAVNHNVMGKLELLDTENGKIAQNLVKAGYPLFVSSRAAGEVNEKTHEVKIAQIFTYDIVCTPGFKEARLERVNESLNAKANQYLTESVSAKKLKTNDNQKYNISDNNIDIYELNESVDINDKNRKYDMNDITKPLLEEDENLVDPINKGIKAKQTDFSEALKDAGLELKSLNPADNKVNKNNKLEDISEDIKEKEDKKLDILDISAEESKEPKEVEKDKKEEKENKEDKKSLILDIKKEKKKDKNKEENNEKVSDDIEETKETKEDLKDKEEVKESLYKKDRITKQVKEDEETINELIQNIEAKNKVQESIYASYPFSISLSENNFNKFVKLSAEQKKKCNDFIVEHAIYDVKSINDLWETPLNEEKRLNKNWLKLASPEDIKLFTEAPIEVQNAIEESAKFVILETKEDVDAFWQRTGLRQQEAQKIMNEEFIKKYKNVMTVDESNNETTYNNGFIKMIEDIMLNN